MADIMEKIAAIELEMSRTQKNKATAAHLGSLKAKLAKLRRDLMEPSGKSGPKGEGFDVTKTGDCRVGLVGFPSVGKSTLLNKLTGTFSEVAAYEFTTLTCIPGVIRYRGAKIQLLDLPGIIEGAKDGKGRGRQVISTARTCNVIVITLDATKPLTHKQAHRARALRARDPAEQGTAEDHLQEEGQGWHRIHSQQQRRHHVPRHGDGDQHL